MKILCTLRTHFFKQCIHTRNPWPAKGFRNIYIYTRPTRDTIKQHFYMQLRALDTGSNHMYAPSKLALSRKHQKSFPFIFLFARLPQDRTAFIARLYNPSFKKRKKKEKGKEWQEGREVSPWMENQSHQCRWCIFFTDGSCRLCMPAWASSKWPAAAALRSSQFHPPLTAQSNVQVLL